MSERGRYFVLEGHDGTGKSFQAQRLRKRLGEAGVKVANFIVEEPDGATTDDGEVLVPISTELRKIIKNGTLQRDPLSNVLLFSVSRSENWQQAMLPALDRGETVVTARSWVSTVAYQGYGEQLGLGLIKDITAKIVGTDYMNPDLELILSLEDEKVRKSRISSRGETEVPDTFEKKPDDYQDRVKKGYLAYAAMRGLSVIDASGHPDVVEELVWEKVSQLL